MISTLVFIITLSVLIIVHEFGHFIVAKRLGIRIEKFSLGFGPEIFKVKRGDTQYIISLIPLGGYVKMAGDNPQDFKNKEDEFLARSPSERAKVIFAGPLLNYILAFLCFWMVFFIGYPTLTTRVGEVMKGYPAQKSGILEGDRVLMIDNQPVKYWDELSEIIHNKKFQPAELLILRDRRPIKLTLYPRVEKMKNLFGKEVTIGLIGIRPSENMIMVRHGFWASSFLGLQRLFSLTAITFKGVFYMVTGSLPFKESVTGPLGIFNILSEAAHMGLSILINVVGVLSMSLAIFNLLPLPVLDGGHILFLLIEKVRGRQMSEKVEDVINQVGVSFLILLAIFIFYNDLVRFGVFEKVIKFLKG
ncbi:MAG: RIP metalloprotease RseP [Candidatus Omnitrophota bacterium]